MDMPQEELLAFRDAHAATSGAADNMVKAVKALYAGPGSANSRA